jgi:CRP-like cAMP-binding protein
MMTKVNSDLVGGLLRQQPSVKDFTPRQVDRLAQLAELVTYEPDQVIHHEGDECSQFFLVVRGSVAIEMIGRREVLRVDTVGPGEEFGWSAMLKGAGRLFQARALGEVAVLAFDAAALRRMCEEDTAFGYALMRRLLAVSAERLQATRLEVLDMHWTPAKRAGA